MDIKFHTPNLPFAVLIHEINVPMAITVKGNAQVVILDADSYQRMVDELDHVRFIAAVCESEIAVQAGQVQDIDQAFSDIRDESGNQILS